MMLFLVLSQVTSGSSPAVFTKCLLLFSQQDCSNDTKLGEATRMVWVRALAHKGLHSHWGCETGTGCRLAPQSSVAPQQESKWCGAEAQSQGCVGGQGMLSLREQTQMQSGWPNPGLG